MRKLRAFGGKTYICRHTCSTKQEAQRIVDSSHERGYLARMSRNDSGGWDVWYRPPPMTSW